MKYRTATEVAINIETMARIKSLNKTEKVKLVRRAKKLIKSLIKQYDQ